MHPGPLFTKETGVRLTTRSREVSKPRDAGLGFSNSFDIWQESRQQRYRDACHISERYDHYNTLSCGKTSARLVNRGSGSLDLAKPQSHETWA